MRDMFGTVGSFLLSLVGLIAVGALIYYGYSYFRTGGAVQDLGTLAGNIQAAYANEATFTTVTNTVANSAGWTPKDMNGGGSTITNQWGGTVTVNVDGTNPANFDITEAGVPNGACAKLAQSTENVLSVTVNGTALTIPVDAATAEADCTAGSANSLVFVYGH